MPIPANQWLKGQTLSNGFCGYHSIAEAFVRVARNRPELINDEFFNQENPIFRPAYDFLKHSLNIQGEFTPGSLQAALLREDVRFNGAFIAQHIAPVMFVLALTHYRTAITPARTQFLRQEPGLQFNAALNLAAELAMGSLQQYDPFGGIEANRDIERAHYVEYLSLAIYNWEEEHELFDETKKIPLVARFLNSQDNNLTAATAAEFSNLVYNQGLMSYAQLPTISIFDNLCRLMFRPIAIEADNGVAAPIPYYPVSIVSEAFLSMPHHLAPHEIIAAVYRCSSGAHFQYALPPLCVQEFHENVSHFYPQQRMVSAMPPLKGRIPSKKNNKAHHAILQKQALAKVRAEKHAKFMQLATEQERNTSSTDLNQQIKSLEFQIKNAEREAEEALSSKNGKKKSKKKTAVAHTTEINKLREKLVELKKIEAAIATESKKNSSEQRTPVTFSASQPISPPDLSHEKQEIEAEIARLTKANTNNQNEAQIEILQLQLEQLRLIEQEISEKKSIESEARRSYNPSFHSQPIFLSNRIFPQELGPIGRMINYLIDKIIEFLMRRFNDISGALAPRVNRAHP